VAVALRSARRNPKLTGPLLVALALVTQWLEELPREALQYLHLRVRDEVQRVAPVGWFLPAEPMVPP